MRYTQSTLVPALLALLTGSTAAQCDLGKLEITGSTLLQNYGAAVAMDGDWAVIGAPLYASDGSGAAEFRQRTPAGWLPAAVVANPDPNNFGRFGDAVDIEGTLAVVGVPGDGHDGAFSNAGAARVYELQSGVWVEIDELVAGDPATDDRFGDAVAISGDVIAVGATSAGPGNDGAVYVFRRNGGGTYDEETKIVGPSIDFGYLVELSGNTLAVAGGTEVRVYTNPISTLWPLQIELVTGTKVDDVALEGDRLAVQDPSAFERVHVYERTAGVWGAPAEVSPSDGVGGDDFGAGIALSGDFIAVGSSGADHSGETDAGAVYVFEKVGGVWTEQEKLVRCEPDFEDRFGAPLALDGDHLLAGCPFDNHEVAAITDSGRVIPFERSGGAFAQSARLALHVLVGEAAGGSFTFALDAGPASANGIYFLMGSVTGTSPGLVLFGLPLPLNPDPYFLFTVNHANTTPLTDSFAALDGDARATAGFDLPPAAAPGLAGLAVSHAYMVFNAVTAAPITASEAETFTIQP